MIERFVIEGFNVAAKTAHSIYNMKKNKKIDCGPIMTVLGKELFISYHRNFKAGIHFRTGTSTSEGFFFQGETYNIGNKPLHFHRPHLLYKPHKNFIAKLQFWWKYMAKKPLQLERWRYNSNWDSDKIKFAPSENKARSIHTATGESIFYMENKSDSSYNAEESFVFREEDKFFWGLYLSREAIDKIIDDKAQIAFNIMSPEWPFLFFDWKYFKAVSKERRRQSATFQKMTHRSLE